MNNNLIVVRGGGDLATGVIHCLWAAGMKVLVLEIAHPAAIRRQASSAPVRHHTVPKSQSRYPNFRYSRN